LALRAQPPVRARVRAGARHPLPVAGVVGYVAVDQMLEEVRRADAPIDPELLRQEGSGDEARAVVHEPLLQQLAHAGVDEWMSGTAFPPGCQRLRVVTPGALARPQVLVGELRARG